MTADRQCILVAVSHPSQGKLHALLDGCEADYFESYAEASGALGRRRYEAAIVGLHFGESRMFDFVSELTRVQPWARVVCVQGTAGQLGDDFISQVRTAVECIGAEGVIDLSRLSEQDCATLGQLLRTAAAPTQSAGSGYDARPALRTRTEDHEEHDAQSQEPHPPAEDRQEAAPAGQAGEARSAGQVEEGLREG